MISFGHNPDMDTALLPHSTKSAELQKKTHSFTRTIIRKTTLCHNLFHQSLRSRKLPSSYWDPFDAEHIMAELLGLPFF